MNLIDYFLDCFSGFKANPEVYHVNRGTKILPLFHPPVPPIESLPDDVQPSSKAWARYGRGTVRLHVSLGKARDDSLSPSEVDTDEEDEAPKVTK